MRDMSYQPILVNGVLTPSFQLIEHIASSLTHNIHQFIVLTSKDTELLEDISSRSSRDLIYEQDLDFQSVIDGMKAQMATLMRVMPRSDCLLLCHEASFFLSA